MQLANGLGWQLITTEGIRPWVEKLASIMKLKVCESSRYPKLIFIRGDSVKYEDKDSIFRTIKSTLVNLPERGWRVHYLGWLQLWSHCDVPDTIWVVVYEANHNLVIESMRLSLYPVYQGAQQSGGFPLHAALVEKNGKGFLLAAPGNTGKSTCCQNIPPSWHALCDDEALVIPDDQQRYSVHPFPTWSNFHRGHSKRSWDIQHHVPLSAIFFLEQADADKAVPIGQGEAAVYINNSASQVLQRIRFYLDSGDVMNFNKKLFENACELAGAIPAFKLHISLNNRFWEEMEKVLPR